jgi:hypothetical protein
MRRAHVYILSMVALVAVGCPGPAADSDSVPDASDASDADDARDSSFVVVDAGPEQPTTATIVTPPDDLVVAQNDSPNANDIPLEVEVEGQTPDAVHLAVNARPEDVLSPPYQYEWSISGRTDGIYRLSAWAILDGKAYPGPTLTITIDNEDGFSNITPEITLPETRRSVDRSLTVQVRAAGLVSNADIALYVNDERLTSENSAGFAEFTLNASGWPEGSVALRAGVHISENSFWSLSRTIDVVHASSNRFTSVAEPLGDWLDVDLEIGQDGEPIVAVANRGAISVFALSDDGRRWERLGTPITEQWQPGLPDLEVAPDGTVYVAWSQTSRERPWEDRRDVLAARWDADESTWVRLGDPIERDRRDDATSALLWLDGGRPYVALSRQRSNNDDAVEVSRWTESGSWQPVGASIAASTRAGTVGMRRVSDDAFLLVWRANFQVHAHRFSEPTGAWISNARPSLDGFANDALWREGTLTIPLFDRAGFRVVEWRGSQWRDSSSGTLPAPDSISSVGGAAVDSDANIVLPWLRYEQPHDLYASRWTGQRWEPLTTAPIEPDIDGDILSAQAAADQGRLFVAYVVQDATGTRVEVREFTP